MNYYTRLFWLTLFIPLVCNSDVYKCKNLDGKVEFKDRPCGDSSVETILEKKRYDSSINSITGDYYVSLENIIRSENRGLGFSENDRQQLSENTEMQLIMKGKALKVYTRILAMEPAVRRCKSVLSPKSVDIEAFFSQYVESKRDYIIVGKEVAKDGYSYPQKDFEISSSDIHNRIENTLESRRKEFITMDSTKKESSCTKLSKTISGAIELGL